MSDLLTDIADAADELTDPRHHSETIDVWDHNRNRKTRRHTTVQHGLLAQLADLFTGTTAGDQGAGSGVPGTRPPGYWDALSRHTAITLAAASWCDQVAIERRASVEQNIRALVGAAAQLDRATQQRLLRDLRRWRTWARIITGWDTPPWTPTAPCPAPVVDTDGVERLCGQRTLRVNLRAATAYCASCGSAWDTFDLRILGKHVQTHNQTTDAQAAAARLKARPRKEDGHAL